MAKEKDKDKYYELSQDTIDQFNDVFNKKAFAIKVAFQFQGCSKIKKAIVISKIPDQYAYEMNKDLLVQINEDLLMLFDDKSVDILLEQEIDKLSINIDTGKIKLIKYDLSTFASLINKHGIEEITRANGLELLAQSQKEDQEADDFIV